MSDTRAAFKTLKTGIEVVLRVLKVLKEVHRIPADRSLDKKIPPPRGRVSAFLCDGPGQGSARLLAIFRRKLCVAIFCSLSG
jgi:hypothetical protein